MRLQAPRCQQDTGHNTDVLLLASKYNAHQLSWNLTTLDKLHNLQITN